MDTRIFLLEYSFGDIPSGIFLRGYSFGDIPSGIFLRGYSLESETSIFFFVKKLLTLYEYPGIFILK
jgi:hypothetical protein